MASLPNDDVLVVVSPGGAGDERKDQDRAAWHAAARCAVVCDGTSSSLYTQAAAEQTVQFAPVLFNGDLRERLAALADYLMCYRQEACRRPPMIDPTVPAAVQAMMQDVVRTKVGQSFQTTCVTARFTPLNDMVAVDVLQVGDSIFLAFAADGTPLWPAGTHDHDSVEHVIGSPAPTVQVVPGDQVLMRWHARAWSHPLVSALIPVARRTRWLVGEFVMAWLRARSRRSARGGVRITAGDLVVVPRYLTGAAGPGSAELWSRVTFSPALHVVPTAPGPAVGAPFGRQGVVTAVLPDDVVTGRWQHFREQFPMGTTFVLASDGLTRAFADAGAFWHWFSKNRERLDVPAERQVAMEELHARLRARGCDDDISLVSVRPRSANPGDRDEEVGHVRPG